MFVVHVELVALEHAVELVETVEQHLDDEDLLDMVETVETVQMVDKLFMHICIEHQKQFV